MANDDFLVPSDVDRTIACDRDTDVYYPGSLLRCFASISTACTLYLLWMYFGLRSPVLIRHPTTLAVYKIIFDMIHNIQYLWLPAFDSSTFYDDDNDGPPYNCNASTTAAIFAFLTQFTLTASSLCFCIISMDLRTAYTNPFSSYKQNRAYYATLVLSASLLTSIALILMGDQVYGYSSSGTIWIQDRRQSRSPNYAKILLYYIVLWYIYFYCIWANFQFYRSSAKGLSRTVSDRILIMNRSKKFTIGFIAYETLVLFIEFLSYLDYYNSKLLVSLPGYLYALKGLWSVIVIFYSNWEDITWELINPFRFRIQQDIKNDVFALEGFLLQPHLNTSLRAEILYFTTQGIVYAAKEGSKHYFDSKRRENERKSNRLRNELNNYRKDSKKNGEEKEFLYNFDDSTSGALRPSVDGQSVGSTRGSILPPRLSLSLNSAGVGEKKSEKVEDKPSTSHTEESKLESGKSREESENASNSHRYTISEIARINAQQEEEVAQYVETAFHTDIFRITQQPQRQKARSVSDSPGTHSFTNPLHALSSNHLLRGKPSAEKHLEMRHTTTSLNELMNDSRVRSVSSDSSTVKWQDTTDVEFTMRHKMHCEDTGCGTNAQQETTEWYRVSSEDASHQRNSSERSSSSNVAKWKRSLQAAMTNASAAAKNVFSPAYQEFRFKDFCPLLFAKMRDMCKIDADKYSRSFEATCKAQFSEGRSGAFMFFSSDQTCIVKTTTKGEIMSLRDLLPDYVKHIEANPESLLVRFLGAHCIVMYGVELYFVVMLNVFPNITLSERYDLKGSWVKRHGFNDEVSGSSGFNRAQRNYRLRRRENRDNPPLFLDNDLQHKVSLFPEVAAVIAGQIRRDILFLEAMDRMDYSLLIGVKRERFEVLSNSTRNSDSSSVRPSFATGSNNALNHENLSLSAKLGNSQKSDLSSKAVNSIPFDNSNNSNLSSRNPLTEIVGKIPKEPDGGLRARYVEGPGTYYLGIIDILQEWSFSKRVERFLKIYIDRQDPDGLSAIHPSPYAARFWQRCVVDLFEGMEEMGRLEGQGVRGSEGGSSVAFTQTSGNASFRGSDPVVRQVQKSPV